MIPPLLWPLPPSSCPSLPAQLWVVQGSTGWGAEMGGRQKVGGGSTWPTSFQHQCFCSGPSRAVAFSTAPVTTGSGNTSFPLLSLQAYGWAHSPLCCFLGSSISMAAFFHPAHCSVNSPFSKFSFQLFEVRSLSHGILTDKRLKIPQIWEKPWWAAISSCKS